MMGLMGGISLIGCSVLVWWMTASAAAGRIPRNAAMGIRTRATQTSDQAWVAGHQGALPSMRATALTCIPLGVAELVAGATGPKNGDLTVPIVALFAVGYGALTVGVCWAARRASVAARSVDTAGR